MSKRRVVITGLGVVTSLGENADALFSALCAGKSGIIPITRWDTSNYPTRFGGECTNFNPEKFGVDAREARRMDRFGQFGLCAAIGAITDSGLDFSKEDTVRCGVIIGSGIGGIETLEEQKKVLDSRGLSRVSPFTIPKLMVNAAAGNVSIRYGLHGPNYAIVTACATGSHSIGDAGKFIQSGMCDIMIAGGSEAGLCELGLASFVAARALSTRNEAPAEASRPWDKDRDGFVMSEGSGIVVLEEYEHAVKRGAKMYAELVGYGLSADGYHITQPEEEGKGASLAMNIAIRDAGISPDQIEYINAHGTSTQLGDQAETRAIKATFGEHAKKLAISSTKSQLGHLLGAAGGVECVITALTVKNGVIAPTINLDHPSEDCDLDYVPKVARNVKVNYALSNSFGFGGHNGCLLLKKV